jgi:hypothetical protein
MEKRLRRRRTIKSVAFGFVGLVSLLAVWQIWEGETVALYTTCYRNGESVLDCTWAVVVTEFASGFSERQFWTIKKGDDAGTVIVKLGQPRSKVKDWHEQGPGSELWAYANNSWDDGGVITFFRRNVVVDRDGHVASIWGDIYQD